MIPSAEIDARTPKSPCVGKIRVLGDRPRAGDARNGTRPVRSGPRWRTLEVTRSVPIPAGAVGIVDIDRQRTVLGAQSVRHSDGLAADVLDPKFERERVAQHTGVAAFRSQRQLDAATPRRTIIPIARLVESGILVDPGCREVGICEDVLDVRRRHRKRRGARGFREALGIPGIRHECVACVARVGLTHRRANRRRHPPRGFDCRTCPNSWTHVWSICLSLSAASLIAWVKTAADP